MTPARALLPLLALERWRGSAPPLPGDELDRAVDDAAADMACATGRGFADVRRDIQAEIMRLPGGVLAPALYTERTAITVHRVCPAKRYSASRKAARAARKARRATRRA